MIHFVASKETTEQLRADLIKIGNEVHALWFHHDFFWRIMEVINNNPRLRASAGHLIDWLKNAYIEAGCVGFRRLLDRNKQSVSLITVLNDLEGGAANFTETWFLGLVTFAPGTPFHSADRYKAAEKDFDRLFGKCGVLNAAIIRSDIDLLLKEGQSIKEFVNKEIAHLDRKGMRRPKPTGYLFEKCINHLEQITGKYFYLVTGQRLEPLRPKFADDFPKELFTFPWVEEKATVTAGGSSIP